MGRAGRACCGEQGPRCAGVWASCRPGRSCARVSAGGCGSSQKVSFDQRVAMNAGPLLGDDGSRPRAPGRSKQQPAALLEHYAPRCVPRLHTPAGRLIPSGPFTAQTGWLWLSQPSVTPSCPQAFVHGSVHPQESCEQAVQLRGSYPWSPLGVSAVPGLTDQYSHVL